MSLSCELEIARTALFALMGTLPSGDWDKLAYNLLLSHLDHKEFAGAGRLSGFLLCSLSSSCSPAAGEQAKEVDLAEARRLLPASARKGADAALAMGALLAVGTLLCEPQFAFPGDWLRVVEGIVETAVPAWLPLLKDQPARQRAGDNAGKLCLKAAAVLDRSPAEAPRAARARLWAARFLAGGKAAAQLHRAAAGLEKSSGPATAATFYSDDAAGLLAACVSPSELFGGDHAALAEHLLGVAKRVGDWGTARRVLGQFRAHTPPAWRAFVEAGLCAVELWERTGEAARCAASASGLLQSQSALSRSAIEKSDLAMEEEEEDEEELGKEGGGDADPLVDLSPVLQHTPAIVVAPTADAFRSLKALDTLRRAVQAGGSTATGAAPLGLTRASAVWQVPADQLLTLLDELGAKGCAFIQALAPLSSGAASAGAASAEAVRLATLGPSVLEAMCFRAHVLTQMSGPEAPGLGECLARARGFAEAHLPLKSRASLTSLVYNLGAAAYNAKHYARARPLLDEACAESASGGLASGSQAAAGAAANAGPLARRLAILGSCCAHLLDFAASESAFTRAATLAAAAGDGVQVSGVLGVAVSAFLSGTAVRAAQLGPWLARTEEAAAQARVPVKPGHWAQAAIELVDRHTGHCDVGVLAAGRAGLVAALRTAVGMGGAGGDPVGRAEMLLTQARAARRAPGIPTSSTSSSAASPAASSGGSFGSLAAAALESAAAAGDEERHAGLVGRCSLWRAIALVEECGTWDDAGFSRAERLLVQATSAASAALAPVTEAVLDDLEMLADILALHGRSDAALRCSLRLSAVSPFSLEREAEIARLWTECGYPDRAEAVWASVDVGPDNAASLVLRARHLATSRCGDTAECLAALAAAEAACAAAEANTRSLADGWIAALGRASCGSLELHLGRLDRSVASTLAAVKLLARLGDGTRATDPGVPPLVAAGSFKRSEARDPPFSHFSALRLYLETLERVGLLYATLGSQREAEFYLNQTLKLASLSNCPSQVSRGTKKKIKMNN